MVVLGRGVGFGQLPYELTDMSVVYRTFYDVDPKYFDVVGSLPQDVVLASADIIEQAEISLGCDLNPNLPFTLADHIAFAIKREQQGIRLAMPLAFDVKHLYPQEYELGLRALEIVRQHTKESLPKAEGSSIANFAVTGKAKEEEADADTETDTEEAEIAEAGGSNDTDTEE